MRKVVLLIILFLFIPLVNARNDLIEVEFLKCTDGDTAAFKYKDEEYKVRFLAVDTPETKHPTKGEEPFGKEASEYTCNAIKNAKTIKLEFDKNSDETDKYNRYLVWVFVDDELLQSKLIENGLAKVDYLYGDYKYTDELKSLEKIAKTNHKGIWGDYVSPKDYTVYYIAGALLLLIILYFIRKKVNNKEVKSLTKKTSTLLNKNIKKWIKKI